MTADEMFEELDYHIECDDYLGVMYRPDPENVMHEYYITFEEKCIWVCKDGESININMEELKAINQKCRELGWLE